MGKLTFVDDDFKLESTGAISPFPLSSPEGF